MTQRVMPASVIAMNMMDVIASLTTMGVIVMSVMMAGVMIMIDVWP